MPRARVPPLRFTRAHRVLDLTDISDSIKSEHRRDMDVALITSKINIINRVGVKGDARERLRRHSVDFLDASRLRYLPVSCP